MPDNDKGTPDGKTPEVKTPVVINTESKTEPAPPKKDTPIDETINLTRKEFDAMQSNMLVMKTELDTIKLEKAKLDKSNTMDKLKSINPQLAELNKDVELSTLKTVLSTAEAMKGHFPNMSQGDKGKSKKDTTIGYRKLGDTDFII